MRICSLLPGATEIAYLLGVGDQIVGVTHECDYPPDAQYKPVVVRSVIDPKRMSSQEIDAKVAELLQAGKGLYTIDHKMFIEASPEVILTQGLCDVCALDYDEVVKASQRLPRMPEIVSLNPRSLGGNTRRHFTRGQRYRAGVHGDRPDSHSAPAHRPGSCSRTQISPAGRLP